MAISYVQSNSSSATAASLTCTFPSNTAGNLLVVCVESGQYQEKMTIADTAGNIWQTANIGDNPSGAWRARIYYAENCNASAGTNTVTITFPTSHFASMAVAEYSGVASSLSFCAASQVRGTGTSASVACATATGGLVIAYGLFINSGIAAGAGLTSRQSGGFWMMADAIASGASFTASMTGTSGNNGIAVASFFASPAPAQSPYAGGDLSSATSVTSEPAVFRSNTAGNLLVASAIVGNVTVAPTLTDTAGNTWELINSVVGPSSVWKQFFYVVRGCAAFGKNVVTLSIAPTVALLRLHIAEYAVSSSCIFTGSKSQSTANITTDPFISSAGVLCISHGMYDGFAVGAGSGWTARKNDGNMMMQDRTAAGNSSTAAIVNTSASATIIGVSVSVASSGGGGAGGSNSGFTA